jgi:hypothetical protein
MRVVFAALLAFAVLGIAGASTSSGPGLVLGDYRSTSAPVLVSRGSGQCFGDCAAEQGMCIAQCVGNGRCIGNCAAAHGRCVSRCN